MTYLIGLIALYIAYQQWKTNDLKQKWRLFDRRLQVYVEVDKFITTMINQPEMDLQYYLRFRSSVSEADFIFEEEIQSYIDEIYKRGLDLRKNLLQNSGQERPKDYDNVNVTNNIQEETIWFSEQLKPAKEKFNTYLNVSSQNGICNLNYWKANLTALIKKL